MIWLCSWYPNQEDSFIGDFIQRHAIAASAYTKIHVIHIRESAAKYPSSYTVVNENLVEEIHYLPRTSTYFFRIKSYLQKQIACINRFILENGKPDGIHVHVPLKAGLIALHSYWYLRIPYVVTEHYGIYNHDVTDHFETRHVLFRILTRWVIKKSKQLSTVSTSLANEMNHYGLSKNTISIPNVVNTKLFSFHQPPSMDTFRWIHISGMTPLKNVAGILQAMENVLHHVPNTELILVGDIRNELVKQVQSSPQLKNQVIFTGVLSYSEVANQIKQAHALVLFSDSESQSCVVLEALCSGRPCIVPATGGVQELIDDHNGFKVNVRDTEHLAIKMIDLQQKYSQYNFQRISEQAIAQYSYEKVGMEFKTLYDRNFQ